MANTPASRTGERNPPSAVCEYPLIAGSCLAILELRVRAAGPVDGRIFDVFRQNTRVANTTEVRLLGGLTHGSDLHELLKNAQPSSTRLHFGEVQQRSIALLP